eukprot:4645748-Amphidinium_carterae.1
MLFAALLPLCFTNLRADVHEEITCSDASEHGGGFGSASRFSAVLPIDKKVDNRSLEKADVIRSCPLCGCHVWMPFWWIPCPSESHECVGRQSSLPIWACYGTLTDDVVQSFLNKGVAAVSPRNQASQGLEDPYFTDEGRAL